MSEMPEMSAPTSPPLILDAALARYGDYHERLSPATLGDLDALTSEDLRFRDPFNELRGRDAYRRVLAHMFTSIVEPRFTILDRASSGSTGYLKWRFAGALRGRNFEIVGMSEITFDARGLVTEHIDHWDAASQFYERIPVLGTLMRLIKKSITRK